MFLYKPTDYWLNLNHLVYGIAVRKMTDADVHFKSKCKTAAWKQTLEEDEYINAGFQKV